jgi:transposase
VEEEIRQLYPNFAKAFDDLVQENSALKATIALLQEQVSLLTKQNKALIEENHRLKERLGLNSRNSSIPSSKELYKIKNDNRRKSLKKPGGQIGHKGASRSKSLNPDAIVHVRLENTTCECGGIIVKGAPHIHQVIEIPPVVPHITEYQMERARCSKCGRRKRSNLPKEVPNDIFGPRVKTIIAALTSFYKNSKREVQVMLKDLFGLDISLGSISNTEERVSSKTKDNYETIELELSYAKSMHIDETSHYNKGKMGWAWLFSNLNNTLLKLTESRGKKILINSVFGSNDYDVIITDRYAAYNYFVSDKRQICWAHLLRDFERFKYSKHQKIKAIGEYMTIAASEIFALKNALLSSKIDQFYYLRRSNKIRKRLNYYLKNIERIDDAPHAVRVAKNLLKSENMMWAFLRDAVNIPLTNNHAERMIRYFVVYRKNSYHTWSDRGQRFLERCMSLYLTCKQKSENPYLHLYKLVLSP